MSSPIVSASDAGTRTAIKRISTFKGRPSQSYDLIIQLDRDFQLSIELSDLNLSMLGTHQLRNAVTATCTALYLRNQGWRISDGSIRDGLENTSLQGRTQFLTSKEAETLGLPGSTVLLDGGRQLEAVFLTEADIAGGTSRTTSASVLRDCWMQASKELGIKVLHNRMAECRELFEDKFICSARDSEHEIIVAA